MPLASGGDECCLWLSLITETYVVIATVEIQSCEDFGPTKLGEHFIYLWQWIQAYTSFGTSINFCLHCIDPAIVHTHLSLGRLTRSRFLGDYHYGAGASALLNYSCTFELFYFFLDPVMMLQR